MRKIRAFLYGLSLFLLGCAQIITPTGGPKDETPPKVVGEWPANQSVNFSANQIEIEFDEFIVFDKPSENVIISPPLLKSPIYALKQKSLIIKLPEQLAPNATYIFNFGEAIRDNHEGNILNNYTYVFSTGAQLDSMELKGKLVDAVTSEPVEGAMLMLYRSNQDSLPKTTLPDFFARTAKDGQFHIRNIPDLRYKIFALKDQNTNYRFDVPNEMIGFLDTLVRPDAPIRVAKADTTIQADTSAVPKIETPVIADTTSANKGAKGTTEASTALQIKMFEEEDTTQFLKKASCEHFGKYVFVYNRPVGKFSALLPANVLPSKRQWAIKEFSAKRDTITLWATANAPDTLDLILSIASRKDTIQLVNKARNTTGKPDSVGKRGSKSNSKKFELTLQTNPSMGKPPKPDQPIQLIWNHPVVSLDLNKIELREDSVPVNFNLNATDTALRKFALYYDWKVGKHYQVHLSDSAAIDVFGLKNDTIDFNFTAIDNEKLGDITLNVSNIKGQQKLIELVDGAKRTVASRVVNANGALVFPQLEPGKYALLMIDDQNGNGRWDSGRYAFHQQPEPIVILKSDIDVRANWQMDLEWDADEAKIKSKP